jgi:DNA-binding NtrC family response regulator
LRQRREDIAALAAHFVNYHNRGFGKRVNLIAERMLEFFRRYEWPGNVRELAHVVEGAVLLCDSDRIDLTDLPDELRTLADESANSLPEASPGAASPDSRQPPRALDEVLKDALKRSLIAAQGDCARAAQFLGISRPAIYRKMARFGITQAWLRQFRRGAVGNGKNPADEAAPVVFNRQPAQSTAPQVASGPARQPRSADESGPRARELP